jgi:hypothetical protein
VVWQSSAIHGHVSIERRAHIITRTSRIRNYKARAIADKKKKKKKKKKER